MKIIKQHSNNLKVNTIYKKEQIKGIAIHYVGSYSLDGSFFRASAQSTVDYLNTVNTYTGYNYVVDEDEIIELVPPDVVTWHIGSPLYFKYAAKANKEYKNGNKGASYFLIGIGCVHKEDGSFTAGTMINLRWLVRRLVRKYEINKKHIIRHYDVTGKLCPAYYIKNHRWKNLYNFLIK